MGYFIKWRSIIRNTIQRKNIYLSPQIKEKLGMLFDNVDDIIDMLEEESKGMEGWCGIFLKSSADSFHSWLDTARGNLF